jgi:hypothetical protein
VGARLLPSRLGAPKFPSTLICLLPKWRGPRGRPHQFARWDASGLGLPREQPKAKEEQTTPMSQSNPSPIHRVGVMESRYMISDDTPTQFDGRSYEGAGSNEYAKEDASKIRSAIHEADTQINDACADCRHIAAHGFSVPRSHGGRRRFCGSDTNEPQRRRARSAIAGEKYAVYTEIRV